MDGGARLAEMQCALGRCLALLPVLAASSSSRVSCVPHCWNSKVCASYKQIR